MKNKRSSANWLVNLTLLLGLFTFSGQILATPSQQRSATIELVVSNAVRERQATSFNKKRTLYSENNKFISSLCIHSMLLWHCALTVKTEFDSSFRKLLVFKEPDRWLSSNCARLISDEYPLVY